MTKRIGRQLTDLCRRKGIKGIDLAKMAGVTPSHISVLKSGRRMPSFFVLLRIAEALGVPLSYFKKESKLDREFRVFLSKRTGMKDSSIDAILGMPEQAKEELFIVLRELAE